MDADQLLDNYNELQKIELRKKSEYIYAQRAQKRNHQNESR